MSTPKRTYEDVDPDYTDVCEQQNKRQRAIEQDAKQSVCKRIQAIVRNEFQKEINSKEMELHQIDKRLNEARLMMDRLRACIVSTYYRQMNQFGTPEMSSVSGSSPSIHPAVKKCLGKRPLHHETTSDSSMPHTQTSSGVDASSNSDCKYSDHHKIQSIAGQHNNTSRVTTANQPTSSSSSSSSTFAKAPAVLPVDASYDDRRARFKIKKKVIIGNVSKYIPVDHREANDKSSHKWMIYVRGPRSEPDISGFVKKVWFFLHHSYKPNDLVEISSPPFHLTRRGWGEFPVRVQLHFVDPRNKKVDIIHQLKLDKTFSGLQTLGAETTVEVDLEKDFFEADGNSSNPMGQSSSSSSSSSSLYHQAEPSFSSLCMAAPVPAERPLPASHKGNGVLLEQSDQNLHEDTEAGDSGMDCESVMDNKYAPSQCVGSMHGMMEGCVTDLATGLEPVCEVEAETTSLETEYNVTIVHETNDSHLHEQEEDIVVTDEAGALKHKLEPGSSSTADFPRVSDLQTTQSASFAKIQQEHSSAKSSMQTPLTIIRRPQWVKSADTSIQSLPVTLSSSGIDQSLPITGQLSLSGIPHSLASTSANTVNQSQFVDSGRESLSLCSVDHNPTVTAVSSQSNNYIFVEPSGLTVKPAIKQLCPSASPLPPSLSILPVLNSAKIIVPTLIGCAQSPSSQHISASTSTASSGPKSAVGQSVISLSQLTHQKFPQPSHPSSDSQKFIIIKPNLPDVKPQIAVPSAAAPRGKSLLQPKPTGPKQVSLLTGRVFTPPTPPPVATKVFSPSQRTKESLLAKHSLVTKDTCNNILASQNLTNQLAKSGSKQGQLLVLKTVNHPTLTVSQATNYGANQLHNSVNIKLVNGLLGQDVNSHTANVSLINSVTPDGLMKKPELPLTILNNCNPINNVTCQTLQHRQTQMIGSDIVLHVPGQSQTQLTNGHSVSSFPKMSAIGITKHGKNSSIMPVMNTNLRSTTDEERKQNQYAVLMAWKRNRHLQEKATAGVKVVKDTIEGEAEIIPELNLDDHSSLRTLVKAAVRLHPLVQAGVNKLTHPYCAESLEQWNAWPVGKQLGSEWHRACFVLKYLKTLLATSTSFRGESLMSTRQLVHWCRCHAYSPMIAVLKAKPGKLSDSVSEDSTSCLNDTHVPSFTASSTLENELLATAAVQAPDDGGRQEVDVVAAGDIDNAKTKTLPDRIQESSEVSKHLEWLRPSDGAIFVHDELRKRGIKLQPVELEQDVLAHSAAEMLYMAMQEFIGDILREAAAVSSSQSSHSSDVEITRRDVHKALTQLPEAAFACNQYLGKCDDVTDSSER